MKSILKTLKLLTDPTRLRIINVLDEESLSVAELQEILGMGQSRISTQLAQLRQEGLVEDTRSGKNVFYTLSLADDLHNVALKACGELPEAEADKKALQVILDKRRNRTQAYFDEVVCRLGKNYAPGRSWKALAGALLRILNYDVVADLGAGEGFVSQLISPSAKRVIAVDNSPSMVELGQELARKHGLDNLEYRLGDIESPPLSQERWTWPCSARPCTMRTSPPKRWKPPGTSLNRADAWSFLTCSSTARRRRGNCMRTAGWASPPPPWRAC